MAAADKTFAYTGSSVCNGLPTHGLTDGLTVALASYTINNAPRGLRY